MKKSLKIKSLFGALALFVMMSGSSLAKAELTEEEVNREGEATYVPITEEENKKHEEDNKKAQEEGKDLPAEQDAGAVISDVPGKELEDVNGSNEWVDYTPTEDDTHPAEGLEDEIDRKNPDIPKTGDDSARRIWLALASVGITSVGVHEIVKYRKFAKVAKKEEIKSRNM